MNRIEENEKNTEMDIFEIWKNNERMEELYAEYVHDFINFDIWISDFKVWVKRLNEANTKNWEVCE